MKFRVYFPNGRYFPTYFYRKRDAVAFQAIHGGEIQRKIGGDWFGY